MSVLIKGMKMPECCAMCPLCHRCFDGNETKLACYGVAELCDENIDRLNNCPLVEVSEKHGRLFDEAEVKKVLHGLPNSKDKWGAIALLEWAIEKRWCVEAEDE